MRRKAFALLSLSWLTIIVILSVAVPLFNSIDPLQPVGPPFSMPNGRWLLGTDALGRDLWTRMVYGARLSLGASLLAATISITFGSLIGLFAAGFRGWFDRVIIWLTNALLAIPGLLLAMILVAGMGPGLLTVILAVGLGGVPGFIRISRTIFIQIHSQDYIRATEALGGGRLWILRKHLFPNALSHLFSIGTVQIAWAFLGMTTLTFLGLAGDPSTPEWGIILNAGRLHLIEFPHLAIISGSAITLTIMSIHNLGGWLSKTTDPIQREQAHL
jgi:peptide/nickel transport system permease protein